MSTYSWIKYYHPIKVSILTNFENWQNIVFKEIVPHTLNEIFNLVIAYDKAIAYHSLSIKSRGGLLSYYRRGSQFHLYKCHSVVSAWDTSGTWLMPT